MRRRFIKDHFIYIKHIHNESDSMKYSVHIKKYMKGLRKQKGTYYE